VTPAADAIQEVAPPVAPASGVRLDDGEIVLLATRQHWSVPMLLGGAPSLLLLGFLAILAIQRSAPMPSSVLGVLAGLAVTPLVVAMARHTLRRYVLTDRRVIVRHGRDVRWIALTAVREVEASSESGRPGDVRFRSAQGVLLWPRVPDAAAAAEIAREAIDRYGRN